MKIKVGIVNQKLFSITGVACPSYNFNLFHNRDTSKFTENTPACVKLSNARLSGQF